MTRRSAIFSYLPDVNYDSERRIIVRFLCDTMHGTRAIVISRIFASVRRVCVCNDGPLT